MLGLRQEVERDLLGARARGRDDQDVAGAVVAVDADVARDQALGLLNPDAARAGDDVRARDALRPVGERRDGLGAADAEDAVGPAQRGGGEDDRVRAGRGDDDLVDLGGPRGHHAHDDGARVGVPSAGRVDGGAGDGHLAQHDALTLGQLDRRVAGDPGAGDRADVGDRDLEAGADGAVERREGGVELVARDLERLPRRDAVEALGVLAHGRVPARADVAHDAGDLLADAGAAVRGPGAQPGGERLRPAGVAEHEALSRHAGPPRPRRPRRP